MPEENKIIAPPRIIIPPKKKLEDDKTLKEVPDSPQEIVYITGKNYPALVFDIASLAILFAILSILMRVVTEHRMATVALPLILVALPVIYGYKKFYKVTDGQDQDMFSDAIFSRRLFVYTQGFHFLTWSSKFMETKSTQKNLAVSSKKEVIFVTNDGFWVVANLDTLFRFRAGKEAASQSAKYRAAEIDTLIGANIEQELSRIGGANSFESILYWRGDFVDHLTYLFGGENRLSIFEKKTGTSINNPVLGKMVLTEASEQAWMTRASSGSFSASLQKIMRENRDLTIEAAVGVIKASSGLATESIITINGVKGAKSIFLGSGNDALPLIGTSGKGGKGGKKGKS